MGKLVNCNNIHFSSKTRLIIELVPITRESIVCRLFYMAQLVYCYTSHFPLTDTLEIFKPKRKAETPHLEDNLIIIKDPKGL